MPYTIDPANLDRDDIRGLDQAMYVAGCFAASAPRHTVYVWVRTDERNDERYAVVDSAFDVECSENPPKASTPWRAVFKLEHVGKDY